MSLILCRQEPVKIPLYIEDLGIHIYSSQKLCYVIYNNPLLVLEEKDGAIVSHQQVFFSNPNEPEKAGYGCVERNKKGSGRSLWPS